VAAVEVPSQTQARLAAVRAVAIDLDGTLLDTIHDLSTAANRMLQALGYAPLPREALREMVGKGMVNLVRRSLATASGREPDEPEMERAMAVYRREYLAVLGDQTEPFPGVVEGIEAMRTKGIPLACITNKIEEFARRHLEDARLADRFALVIGGDSLPAKKPDPLPLLHTAAHFGVAPRELLLVGDSRNDTQAARAAGCPVLVVPYGYSEGLPVHELDADGIVDSLATVGKLLSSRHE